MRCEILRFGSLSARVSARRVHGTAFPAPKNLIEAMHQLNERGQKTALKRVRELGKLIGIHRQKCEVVG